MFTEYKEIVSHPGRLEHEHPMVAYIDTNDLYNETDGDVQSPTGWFGQAGKWIVTVSSQGFVYGHKFDTLAQASDEMALLKDAFSEWADPWDDGTE
jgi:hypothetical protein